MARSKRKPVPADCGQETCENYKFRTVEPNDTICDLCTHEYCRLRQVIIHTDRDHCSDLGFHGCRPRHGFERTLIQQAERDGAASLFYVLRALYCLIVEDNSISAMDAYEELTSFAPQVAAQVFDFNQKVRTGGSVYPSLSGRIHALLEEEAARQEKIKEKQAEEAAKQDPVEAPTYPSIVDDGGIDSVPW
jgi:hypothetical protein